MWWVVYYGDSSRLSNRQSSPRNLPRTDVQAIAQWDPLVGYVAVSGFDYYYWEPELGGWAGTNGFGLYDHLLRCSHPLVLFGRQTTTETYRGILERMRRELGEKSGWLSGERHPDDS